jgi:hypothetical protein
MIASKTMEVGKMPRKKKPNDGTDKRRSRNPNWENLKKFNEMDPEEHRRLSSLGGQRTKELYAQRKTFKQVLEWALELPAVSGDSYVEKIREQFPTLTNRDAMVLAMVAETVKNGNAKAFKELRDTTGEIPAQTVNVKNEQPMTITVRTIDNEDAEITIPADDED